MIRRNGMVLIGATGRNTGKTTFACRCIASMARCGSPVVAVKITVIRENDGGCPRGGAGCGVCSSLQGAPFILTREDGTAQKKDTARMLESGADEVYWLRVACGSLERGLAALFEHIPATVPIIAESNTARLAVEPDLFLVLRDEGTAAIKKSCSAVIHLSDVCINSDGERFAVAPEMLAFHRGRFTLQRQATAVIVAGGKSSRMGQDKALLRVNGVPLIERTARVLAPHFDEVIISAADDKQYAFTGLRTIADNVPGEGPLRGIACALGAAKYERLFVCACDIPDIDIDSMAMLLRGALRYDAVIPVSGQKRYEPLFACYTKRALPAFERVLSGSKRAVTDILPYVNALHPPLSGEAMLVNLNTPNDYENYRRSHGDPVV